MYLFKGKLEKFISTTDFRKSKKCKRVTKLD